MSNETTTAIHPTTVPTTTSSSTTSAKFMVDDLNFTGYQMRQLQWITNYELLLNTRFPKLAIVLFEHPRLLALRKQYEESKCFKYIVMSINSYAFNLQGNIMFDMIDITNATFWNHLLHVFEQDGNYFNEALVIQRVNNTLKAKYSHFPSSSTKLRTFKIRKQQKPTSVTI